MAVSPQSFHAEEDNHEAITRMIMQLFEHWKLTYEQQAALLSLSTNTHSTIARYKRGAAILSRDRDTQDRIGHLLAIHKYLRSVFPLNKELAYAWPTTANRYFLGKTPIEIIADEGFLGLVRVRRYLENYIAS
jgi:hypothetical protein